MNTRTISLWTSMTMLGAMLATTAMAQAQKQQAPKAPAKEMITLEVRGSDCKDCASVLTKALSQHGVTATVQPMKGQPNRFTVTIDPNADLGACEQAIKAAQTDHKSTVEPQLNLVLFAKLDKDSIAKINQALAALKGVDAKNSMPLTTAGEINVRVVGGAKVTADQIRHALQGAGIMASFAKTATS